MIADSFNESINRIVENPIQINNSTLTKLHKKYTELVNITV